MPPLGSYRDKLKRMSRQMSPRLALLLVLLVGASGVGFTCNPGELSASQKAARAAKAGFGSWAACRAVHKC